MKILTFKPVLVGRGGAKYNSVLHVSGSLGVISMLRTELLAVLPEEGSECIGNPIQNMKI